MRTLIKNYRNKLSLLLRNLDEKSFGCLYWAYGKNKVSAEF